MFCMFSAVWFVAAGQVSYYKDVTPDGPARGPKFKLS